MAKKQPHFLPSGKEYTGKTHTAKGKLMTGEKHTKSSKNLSHSKKGTA